MEENKNNAIEKTEKVTNKNNSKFNPQKNSKKDKVKNSNENKEKRLNASLERAKKREELAEERQKRKELKLQKIEEKNRIRAEKREEREKIRQEKRRQRQEKGKNSKGNGGWIAAVISLSCAVLILGGLLTLTYFTPLDEYMSVNTTQQKNFYDLVGYVDNLDVNLSKLVVSNDEHEQQKLLSEVRVQSSLATNSLAELSLQDESKYNTTKFINQVGDFSKYLNNKLIEGQEITSKDKETLRNLHEINLELKNNLLELSSNIDENFDFRSIFEGKDDNLIISKFNELESNATDYPHMIYDGAFSDGVKGKTLKALEGKKEVSKTEVTELYAKYFKNYNVKDITLNGETKGKGVECYDISGVSEDGSVLDAQITKKGGKVLQFNYYKECSGDNYDAISCEEIASEFLESLGFNNLKAVWMTEGNHVATFNFASVVDGIICYPDLVKVNVCKERGVVSGLEASSYYYNHVKRDIPTVSVSLSQAKSKVSSEIEIQTSRLAIIPKGESNEVLAYEFMGERNGDTYYVYIDAITGYEVDIFKVVKTTEGTLLM